MKNKWRYTVIGNNSTKFFMWSHIIGWLLANIQTVWIVWEIRQLKKGMDIHDKNGQKNRRRAYRKIPS